MDLKRLTRPEYLSDRELRIVLQSYSIPVTDDMSRCEVLQLFRKVALPLPQRENPPLNDTSSRRTNVQDKSEQEMDVDDHELCSTSKFSSQSVSLLGSQLQNIVRISNRSHDHDPINVDDSSSNVRKRFSSSEIQHERNKNRKLSEKD